MIDFHDRRIPNFDTYGFDRPGGPNYEPPLPLRCGTCGAFLRAKPDKVTPWEQAVVCDGSVQEHYIAHEWAVYDILGPGGYTEYVAACGPVSGPHPPHREVLDEGTTTGTKCRKCHEWHTEGGY